MFFVDRYVVAVIILELVLSVGLTAGWLARYETRKSPQRIAWLAALPLPSLIWLLCIYLFVDATLASQEECGVDVCGMAMAAAMIVAMMTAVAYGIGVAAAYATRRLMRRSSE